MSAQELRLSHTFRAKTLTDWEPHALYRCQERSN
jgi:hypothetical protein